MKKYKLTPEDGDELLTYEEYLQEVKAKRAPDLITALRVVTMKGSIAAIGPIAGVSIEKVDSMKGRSYWRVQFESGKYKYNFTAYVNGEKKVYEGRELLVRDMEAENTAKYEFNTGLQVGKVTSFRESEAQYRSRVGYKDKKILENLLPPVEILFAQEAPGVMKWSCSYCPGAGACQHRWDYWAARKDAYDLDQMNPKMLVHPVGLRYSLAGGYYNLFLTLEAVRPEQLGFPEDDPPLKRLSFREHLSLWMEQGTSGMDLIRQLIDIVVGSTTYAAWQSRLGSPMGADEKCSNKYHAKRDSRAFNDTVRTLSVQDKNDQLGAFILANAFADYFDGRCIPCVAVQEAMKNDVPNQFGGTITGPATKHSPF